MSLSYYLFTKWGWKQKLELKSCSLLASLSLSMLNTKDVGLHVK